MKSMLFAAALMLGGSALAQNTVQPDPADEATTAEEQTMPETGTAPEAPPAPQAPMPPQAPMAPMAQPAPTAAPVAPMAPGNQAPARDARGIAVISDPAMAPAGVNGPPMPAGSATSAAAAFATQPSTETYPTCSRTVTDNCVQAYERGARPR